MNLARFLILTTQGEIRLPWRLGLYIAIAVLGMAALWMLLGPLFTILPTQYLFHSLILLAAILSAAFCRILLEHRAIADIGVAWSRLAPLHVLEGLGIGMGMLAATAFLLWLFGLSWTVHLEGEAAWRMAFSGLLLAVLVASAEEILYRGYPWLVLEPVLGSWWTTVLIAMVFAAGHGLNPSVNSIGIINIALAGIWLGRARARTGTLWLPIGLHAGWNLAQGPLLGFPVSGLDSTGILRPLGEIASWISGGTFGPEGGLAATLVLVVGILALEWIPFRSRNRTGDESIFNSKSES